MSQAISLSELEQAARERLPQMVYDYFAGGAGAEVTLRENEAAWSRLPLRPRVLVDVSACDLRTTILGRPAATPIMIAPCALNTLAHAEGELAVARAAAAAGVVYVVSTLAGFSLEDVAVAGRLSSPGAAHVGTAASAAQPGAAGTQWFQLYCYRDRAITRELVQRAAAAGYAAICVTVDVPVHGPRERDARNRFRLPSNTPLPNLAQRLPNVAAGSALGQYISEQFDPSLTWASLAWLRSLSGLPLVVKGVLTAEDARLAVTHGAAGVVVSNHGGRQLDTAVSTCAALPEVVAAAAGAAEVFVDGGIRRGTDVLKALARGARAVLIGRPYLWGLAVDGEAGVRGVLDLLGQDFKTAMALCGCASVGGIDSAHVG